MIPTQIVKPDIRCSRPNSVAALSALDGIEVLPPPRRDGGSHRAARGKRCLPTPMSRGLATLSLAAAGLGLAACSTNGARPSPLSSPSTSHPTTSATSASAAPTDPAPSSADTPPPSTAAPACAVEQSWPTGPQDGGLAMTDAPLYLVRAGRHECYDRVVFDLNGPGDVGYAARYVPVVRADGSGWPVPVEGHAALEVVVRGPIYGTDNQGHQPWRRPPMFGDDFVAPAHVAGWASLAEVKFAGSFEGQSTFAIGVRETRPFRVWIRSEQSYRHVVVDIAH
jgi:hypothetical protein